MFPLWGSLRAQRPGQEVLGAEAGGGSGRGPALSEDSPAQRVGLAPS